MKKYSYVVVAGTFDGLHRGHEAVLGRAFERGERVIIGLTTGEYVHRYKLEKLDKLDIKPYSEREKALEAWLAVQTYDARATIIPLDDPYGPVIPQHPHDPMPPEIEAIVVSTETRLRADEINRLRTEAGWKPLAIIEVPMVAAEDLTPISSTRVRRNEIDRNGRLIMPDNLRPELRKPLGRVIRWGGRERGSGEELIITVGDVATKTFLDAGVVPAFAIIDGKVGRKPFYETLNMLQLEKVSPFQARRVKSGPGYISREAMTVIKKTIERGGALPAGGQGGKKRRKKPYILLVGGEEDLLALPAIAEAPIGSVVYYGQPSRGLVEVVVTSEKKREVRRLLAQFLS